MKELICKNIIQLKPYVAGKPIEEVKRQLGLKEVIKLASNENPLGPSPKAISIVKKNLARINRYPDSNCFYLKLKLAKVHNLTPECFTIGNGSDELIDIIIKTFVEEDENIITAETTFLEYEIISKVNNRSCIRVPLKYHKFDLEGIEKKVNKKTKLIFIANPNNPTGTYINRPELLHFLAELPKWVIVVLDEAYDTFIDVDDFPFGTDLIRSRRNIIVLKTFSKSYGLAGLRVGYAVAQPELISFMERVRQPFNVNLLAQLAAEAALDDKDFLEKTRKLILEEKNFLYKKLRELGVNYIPSVANFILLDVGRDGCEVFKEMLKFGVIVRDMEQYGLSNFIRVTIGIREENKKFLSALKKVIKR